MNITTRLAAVSLVLLAAACGGSEPEPQTPTTTEAPAPAPAPVAEAKPEEKPAEPAKPAPLEALKKPASTWAVNGKSLSEVSGDDLVAAAKKAKWVAADATATPAVAGQYESISLPLESGKKKGTLKLVRPAATPGAPETAATAPTPSKLGESVNKDTGAFTYDADADVFVAVELTEGGKAADAKKVLDTLAKAGKAPAGKTGETTAVAPKK